MALYEITFMLNPVIEIVDGRDFNNIEYGIIVEDASGNRATYLPNVFPNKSWSYIKNRLILKAHSTHSSKFYAYKCIVYEKHIIDLLNIHYFQSTYINPFADFMKVNYNTFIPYKIVNSKVSVDTSRNVRNIASINDMLSLNLASSKKSKKNINHNLDFYKDQFNNDKSSMRQASSFLIMAFATLNKEKPFIKKVCRVVYYVNPTFRKEIRIMRNSYSIEHCLSPKTNFAKRTAKDVHAIKRPYK